MSGGFETATQAHALQGYVGGMPSELRFSFSLEKVVNALAYFAQAGVRDLTKLKAAKLLYLADRYHFLHYGRPISGDRYIAMDLGPVPENTYQLTTRLVDPDEVDDSATQIAGRKLQIHRGFLKRYPVLRARGAADESVFSDSEIEALEQTLREFGSKSARVLVDLSHGHQAYKSANVGRVAGSSLPMPYELFLEDAPEGQAQMIRELAMVEQEDRTAAELLRTAARAARAARKRA